MFTILPAHKTHQVIPDTLLLQTRKLHQMWRVLDASRFLARLLRQRYAPVLGQGACGVCRLGAFCTQVRAAYCAVDGGVVGLVFVAWYQCLA